MNPEFDAIRRFGTTVAIGTAEMSSPHLSQRNGSAVREHRNRDGQDGQCAAGAIIIRQSDGPVLDRPVFISGIAFS